MKDFLIEGDSIVYDGRVVAIFVKELWPTARDAVEEALIKGFEEARKRGYADGYSDGLHLDCEE